MVSTKRAVNLVWPADPRRGSHNVRSDVYPENLPSPCVFRFGLRADSRGALDLPNRLRAQACSRARFHEPGGVQPPKAQAYARARFHEPGELQPSNMNRAARSD